MEAAIIRYKFQRAAAHVEWALARLEDARVEHGREQRYWLTETKQEINRARLALDRADESLDAEWMRSKAREEGQG